MSELTYVYAVVRAEKRPPLRAMPPALPGGGPARLLGAADGLWLAVSTVPAKDYDESALQAGLQDLDWVGARAVAHEAVVERFLPCPAVLPMKLFTLFRSDDRAVQHVIRTQPQIERILRRIERHAEWGVRLTWNGQAAPASRLGAGPGSGAAYLAAKRDLRDASRSRSVAARDAAARLYDVLQREAADARRHDEGAAPDARLLLHAAFLVRTEGTGAFRALLRREEPLLGDLGIAVSLTGPWPPYNFV